MKLIRLNQAGISHYIVPVIAVLVISVMGVRVLTTSHADSVTTAATTTTTLTTPTYYQLLNYTSAAQTNGVTQISSQLQSLGSQTFDQLTPGAELDYLVYGKN